MFSSSFFFVYHQPLPITTSLVSITIIFIILFITLFIPKLNRSIVKIQCNFKFSTSASTKKKTTDISIPTFIFATQIINRIFNQIKGWQWISRQQWLLEEVCSGSTYVLLDPWVKGKVEGKRSSPIVNFWSQALMYTTTQKGTMR